MQVNQDTLLLLADVGRLLRVESDRRARIHGMTRAQWIILWRVRDAPGLSQRQLAAFLEVEPITVGRLVDRLQARGVVERRADPDDRRIWRLHLLPAGQAVLEPLEQQRKEMCDIIADGIAPADLAQMADVLARVKSNLLAQLRTLPDDLEPV